jgi:hypothetical protein
LVVVVVCVREEAIDGTSLFSLKRPLWSVIFLKGPVLECKAEEELLVPQATMVLAGF